MILLGFDYGTTNSMVAQYRVDGRSDIEILDRRSSSIQDGQAFIRSPKRLMSMTPLDETRAGGYLRCFLSPILEQMNMSFPKGERVMLTVTVPNAFKDVQCKLMLDTVRNTCKEVFSAAQFQDENVAILPEPVAAALFYVYQNAVADQDKTGLVTICDIGGGTTDLAIVRYVVEGEPGRRSIRFKVVCTDGCDKLGGDDIDEIIADDLIARYDLDERSYSPKTLLAACQALKRILSVQQSATVALTGPDGKQPARDAQGKIIQLSLTRFRLNKLLEQFFAPKLTAIFSSLKKELATRLGMDDPAEVDRFLELKSTLLPIGGTSQIPYLRTIMKAHLRGDLFLLPGETADSEGHAPFDSVVRGAAVYSGWRNGSLKGIKDIIIEERTLHRISIRDVDDNLITIVERNMPSLQPYKPKEELFPRFMDPDGKTFRIHRIDLYEGEGGFVGDTSYGPPPVHLQSLADQLESIDDPIYVHDRALADIPIEIQLFINEFGRLQAMELCVPGGQEDHSDYKKTFKFIQ